MQQSNRESPQDHTKIPTEFLISLNDPNLATSTGLVRNYRENLATQGSPTRGIFTVTVDNNAEIPVVADKIIHQLLAYGIQSTDQVIISSSNPERLGVLGTLIRRNFQSMPFEIRFGQHGLRPPDPHNPWRFPLPQFMDLIPAPLSTNRRVVVMASGPKQQIQINNCRARIVRISNYARTPSAHIIPKSPIRRVRGN